MKYIIEISYDGRNYSGWQVQPNKNTIQKNIEDVLFQVLKERVEVVASGRTDAGVSAIKQVAHFETEQEITNHFVSYCNHLLPEDIRILSVNKAENSFNARYCAKRKTYRYNFYISNINIPVYDYFALKLPTTVNLEIVKKELSKIVGEHDFSAFCAANTEVKNKTRIIYSAELLKCGDIYCLEICGNGFLYNMVRIIAGTIFDIARGKLKLDINEIIKSLDRSKAGKTASSVGLLLYNVEY